MIIKLDVIVKLKTLTRLIDEFGFYRLCGEYHEYFAVWGEFQWHINRFMVVNLGKSIYLRQLRVEDENYTHMHIDGVRMYYHEKWFEE